MAAPNFLTNATSTPILSGVSTSETDIKIHGTNAVDEPALKEMIAAGVFYGRRKNRTHPRMRQYVLHNRNGMEIINLAKTLDMMEAASAFLKGRAAAGGHILVVGTQPAFEDVLLKFAKENDLPVVTRRWLGGTLTNHKIIFKRIEHLKKLRGDLAAGVFEKYTKKERAGIEREMHRLEELVGGIESLAKLPDAVIIIDPPAHMSVVREAKQVKSPIISFANVDTDPDSVDYFVLGNTKSRESIGWFLEKIGQAIRAGRASAAQAEPVAPVQAAGK